MRNGLLHEGSTSPGTMYTPLDESRFLYCSSACNAAAVGLALDAIVAAEPSCRSASVVARIEKREKSHISRRHVATNRQGRSDAPWLGVNVLKVVVISGEPFVVELSMPSTPINLLVRTTAGEGWWPSLDSLMPFEAVELMSRWCDRCRFRVQATD